MLSWHGAPGEGGVHHDARSAGYYRVELNGGVWPILLKKSAAFSKAEKYASEIEILNVRRAFQAEISRRSVLKRRFHLSILRHSEKTDFFNRIGRFLPVSATANFDQVKCKRLVISHANEWSVAMQMSGQVGRNFPNTPVLHVAT